MYVFLASKNAIIYIIRKEEKKRTRKRRRKKHSRVEEGTEKKGTNCKRGKAYAFYSHYTTHHIILVYNILIIYSLRRRRVSFSSS